MTDLSFDPLLQIADIVANYTKAVYDGNTKFIAFLPQLYNQTISVLAQQRLNRTRQNFLSAVKMEVKDEVLIVTMNEDDWLGLHVEAGADSWPMVKTHLQKGKVKTAKDGLRYKVIPLRVWKSSPSANTEKGKLFYEQISKALIKPRYGKRRATVNPDQTVTVREDLLTDIPEAAGMWRVSTFQSVQAMNMKKPPIHSQHVLFRTMSERYPEKWVHPGLKPANILKDADTMVQDSLQDHWDTFVRNELSKKGIT